MTLEHRLDATTHHAAPLDSVPVRNTLQRLWNELGGASERSAVRSMAVLVDEATHVGLYELRPPALEWRAFASYDEVARWLGRPQPQQTSPLSELRLRLRREPTASLAQLARGLAMSTRTLQRMLAEAGTTLSMERDLVRVARVVELLHDPAQKLEAIALDIGCSDRRSLNRLFRRVTGESPAQFRARLRSRAALALAERQESADAAAHG